MPLRLPSYDFRYRFIILVVLILSIFAVFNKIINPAYSLIGYLQRALRAVSGFWYPPFSHGPDIFWIRL